jgi:sn-glycerol 3-phosphate transport system ATP-binding protein
VRACEFPLAIWPGAGLPLGRLRGALLFGDRPSVATVELENVSKRWTTAASDIPAAVSSVSFTANQGELVALLGPSGCGKSTTLRLIAGLDETTSGIIRIAGRDVTGVAPAARGVSMVFQSYALFPHLTVRENIVFGLKVRKVARAEREARLAQASDVLGLNHYLDRRPSQLSGGQQQRVALGRAIVAQTPVCLMDEPLSNLDAQLRAEMRREIRGLQQRLGMTMLYVTHDQVEAMTMADKIVLMNAGHIEQVGTPQDLYETPATVFVAKFVGTPPMNLVPATAAITTAPALAQHVPQGYAPDALTLGVRPENLHLAAAAAPEHLAVQVMAVEYLGADSLIEAQLGGARLLARTPGRAGFGPQSQISLAVDRSALHWFETSSGRRIVV